MHVTLACRHEIYDHSSITTSTSKRRGLIFVWVLMRLQFMGGGGLFSRGYYPENVVLVYNYV